MAKQLIALEPFAFTLLQVTRLARHARNTRRISQIAYSRDASRRALYSLL